MTRHTFQIQLEGLISLLAQNLYADPDVFLREMLQNAHDSIAKRRALAAGGDAAPPGRGDAVPRGQIRICADRAARALTIHDNGCGLTEAEVHDYLATIGRSGTDELRRQIRKTDRAGAVELIGQFGIGLLSAFIVADRVEVVTRAEGARGLRWSSAGDAGYTLEPAERDAIGTSVTLHLGAAAARYLERERLAGIVRTYADFLGVPIYLDADDAPINAVDAPWHRGGGEAGASAGDGRIEAHRRYWEHRFQGEKPLAVCVIDEAFATDDGHGGRARGVLGITDRHIADPGARGAVDLYVSRMFICSDSRDVLPAWARFVRGVIEADGLTLTAARDNAVRNAALHALSRRLGERLIEWLTALSAADHARFVDIMRWHSYHVLQMAVQDEHEAFFRAVADLVPLDSDQGPLTIPQYLASERGRASERERNNTEAAGGGGAGDDGAGGPGGDPPAGPAVYYIAERGAANQYFMLCAARGLRVLDCAEPFAERFLARYADTWPGRLRPVRLDVSGSDVIFEPVAGAERARFAALERAYAQVLSESRCAARIDRFRPVEVPALLTETADAKARRDMQEATAGLDLPAFLRDAVADFVSHKRDPLTLHLNADNPAVAALARRAALGDALTRHALVALYNNALMLSARAIPPGDVRTMFQEYNRVIELLVELSERVEAGERAEAAARASRAGGTAQAATAPTSAMTADATAGAAVALTADATAGASAAADTTGGRSRIISCFVAVARDDPRAAATCEALRALLERPPYCWQVVSSARPPGDDPSPARQPTGDGAASPDEALRRAHCAAADVTSCDPEVMRWIGRAEALGLPLLLVSAAGGPAASAARAARAALSGLDVASISGDTGSLARELAAIVAARPAFAHQAGERALTAEALAELAGLGADACGALAARFATWQELLAADPGETAAALGLRRGLVEAAAEALSEALDAALDAAPADAAAAAMEP